jgi:hypothetical protein
MSQAAEISSWGIQSATVSLFINGAHKASPSELYQLAYRERAAVTNEVTNPQFGTLGQATSDQQKATVYAVQLQPGRLDFAFGATLGDDSLPSLQSDVVAVVSKLCGSTSNALPAIEEIARIAINVRLAKFFAELPAANTEIAGLLPFKLELGTNRDFIFQLNSRATEGNLEFNRILKWSSETIQLLSGVSTDGSQVIMPSFSRELWAASVHFDFNSVVPRPIFKIAEAAAAIDVIGKSILKARESNLRLD